MTLSVLAPSSPKSIRKRKTECSDSIRSKGVRKHYSAELCAHTTCLALGIGADIQECSPSVLVDDDSCDRGMRIYTN
jgi:hypothetical protein